MGAAVGGGSRAGLKQAGRAGRKPRLSPADVKKIEEGLKRGPEDLGYDTSLWTARRVTHLIEEVCGVRYHPGHVWRLLRQLGWSCQRPAGRALERDEEAIRQWKKKRWPELKKSPQRVSHHSVRGRERAERAAEPVPHVVAAGTDAGAAVSLQLEEPLGHCRSHLVALLLSTVSGRHQEWSPQVIEFLKHLMRHVPGPLLVVWDGLPSHRSRAVRDFVAATEGVLVLERLPAYAPELNPVEYLWGYWKHHELPNFCARDFAQLSRHARRALQRMRRRPRLVTAFWKQASLF